MSLIPMRLTIFNKEAKSLKNSNACLGAIKVADRRRRLPHFACLFS